MTLIRTVLVIVFLAAAAGADDRLNRIQTLVDQGDLKQARREFDQLPAQNAFAGTRLYFSSLWETRGPKAQSLMDSALQLGVTEEFLPEARFRALLLAVASDDSGAVRKSAETFLTQWPHTRHEAEVLAIATAYLQDGERRQRQYADRLMSDYDTSYFGAYAYLSGAETAYREGKYKEAAELARKVTRSPDDNLVPAGLVLLSRIALMDNETEQALLNYNILREGFEHAIGQSELTDMLRRISERKADREADEKLAGISYAIQVGVFSMKENAGKMADRIKAYGYKVTTREKMISGKSYLVVVAGRFATEQEAAAAKRKLERGENQLFKIVVNDD